MELFPPANRLKLPLVEPGWQAQERHARKLQGAAEEERLATDLLRRTNAAASQHAALDRLHRTNPELQALRQAIATAQVLLVVQHVARGTCFC